MPAYAIVRWSQEDLKWIVEHYTHKESDLKRMLDILKSKFKKDNLEVMISCSEMDRKMVHQRLKSFLRGAKKKANKND